MIGVASLSGCVRSTHSTEPSSIAENKAENGLAETETMLKHRADPLDDAGCARADQDVGRVVVARQDSDRPSVQRRAQAAGSADSNPQSRPDRKSTRLNSSH